MNKETLLKMIEEDDQGNLKEQKKSWIGDTLDSSKIQHNYKPYTQGKISMNSLNSQIKTSNSSPRIYVACLAAYNNGFLHGSWINVNLGLEHVEESIKEILASSPVAEECEEWEIHDHEGFGNFDVDSCHNLEKLCEFVEFLEEYKNFPEDVISQLVQDFNLDGAREYLEDHFIGEFDSVTDLAYQLVDDFCLLEGVSKTVAQYFDYESYGRDLGYDLYNYDGYFFWNR